jgi:hypothetical protein
LPVLPLLLLLLMYKLLRLLRQVMVLWQRQLALCVNGLLFSPSSITLMVFKACITIVLQQPP